MVRNSRWRNTLLPAVLVMLVALTACGTAADAPPATTIPVAPTAAPAQDVPTSAPTTAASAAAPAAPTMEMPTTAPTTLPADVATAPAGAAPTTAPPTAPSSAAATTPAAATGATVVHATLREWGLDLSQTTVPAGPVHFVVTNTGMMGHNFTIKGSGDALGRTPLFTGDQGAQTLDIILAAGTYTVYCSLPGHAARGQQNTLVVK